MILIVIYISLEIDNRNQRQEKEGLLSCGSSYLHGFMMVKLTNEVVFSIVINTPLKIKKW